jgi:uracil phosphoribosyltransferase
MLILIKHPLITHKLTSLRRNETVIKDFRKNLAEISALMAYEISRDLPLRSVKIETPVETCTGMELSSDIVLIPVLRAGLGMTEGITNLIPEARVGHIGMYRDHETLKPVTYFSKFPEKMSASVVMVLDPMLATGGSASAAIRVLKDNGAASIKLVSIVGAPEGVKRIESDHPDVQIYLAALDRGLNSKGYIIPGLGDAGDRLFGTAC